MGWVVQNEKPRSFADCPIHDVHVLSTLRHWRWQVERESNIRNSLQIGDKMAIGFMGILPRIFRL